MLGVKGGQIVTAPSNESGQQLSRDNYIMFNHKDRGCTYSYGKKCTECPFRCCVRHERSVGVPRPNQDQ